MHIRFSGDTAPAAPKAYSHPPILPHLKGLIFYTDRLDGQRPDDFVVSWSENPRGAVTTFGEVMTEAIRRAGDTKIPLKNKQGQPNKDGGKKIADELTRFLRFVRREFSDSFDDNARMVDEFKSTVNRSWESAVSARNLELNPTNGAWRDFFNLVERHARGPFVQALETVAQKHNITF